MNISSFSPISYLKSSQRVLIVLGLVNHPELGDSSDNMEDELKFFAR
jgi:hypothetical protein